VFLASLSSFGDLSHLGRPQIIDWADYLRPRPTQIAHQTILYELFGLKPLGYHVVNTVTLAAAAIFFRLVLRELLVPRLLAVAIPLLFAVLPTYSTDRFWFAAFGYVLSIATFYLSLYADMRALRSASISFWAWKLLALAALIVSALGYEIVLPLFIAGTFLSLCHTCHVRSRSLTSQLSRKAAISFAGANFIALGAIMAYKASIPGGVDPPQNYLLHTLRIVAGTIAINFGTYGVGLPHATRWSILNAGPTLLATTGVTAAIIFGYLYSISSNEPFDARLRSNSLQLMRAGIVVLGLGYCIFLLTERILFTSTGINNRVAIGGAVGIAISLVSGCSWLGCHLPRPTWRPATFCSLVTALCTASCLILGTLATFWGEAWDRQQAILADFRRQLPELPSGSTVLLDGVCPYSGPAPVFESNWDLTGALEIAYEDPRVIADVTSANLNVRERGLSTVLYGSIDAHYAYEDDLIVFRPSDDVVRHISDVRSARTYFTRTSALRARRCPHGAAGRGVTIFPLDERYIEFENRYLWGR
jgi:hypothetical protein